MEKKVQKDLEIGAKRQERELRNANLLEEYKRSKIKVKDLQINATNNKASVQEKLDYDKGYKDRLSTRKMENEILHKEVLGYNNTKYAKQKIQEETLKTKQHKINPFKDKINQKSIANATKRQKRLQKSTMKKVVQENSEYDETEEADFEAMEDDMEGGLLGMEDAVDENSDQINKMMEMEA